MPLPPMEQMILVLGAALASALPGVPVTGGQTPAPAAAVQASDSGQPLKLELRVFDGTTDVTHECKVRLYPKGQRSNEIPMSGAATAGEAATVSVPVGFYDAQAVRERRGQVIDLRWAEQLLVQRYPDEYGRHLEMINFKPGYGGLQIRPAPADAAGAKGWTAVAYPAGATEGTREVGKAVPAGDDLLLALPNGRYDVKLAMPDKSTQWIRDIEVPADRTRLKTWSAGSGSR